MSLDGIDATLGLLTFFFLVYICYVVMTDEYPPSGAETDAG